MNIARDNRMTNSGFTMIEILIVVAIIGTLAAIAVPNFMAYREKAKITQAIAEIKLIEKQIIDFVLENRRLPNSLGELQPSGCNDPWGRPYRYLPVSGTPQGQLRKDRFLVPVNTDFDLYSMGPDGRSQPPFTANASRDDIVRASNGGYVGLASNY
jgi:general secretion pathway protein G